MATAETRGDAGTPDEQQDRYTFHFQGQYLQWDAPAVNLLFTASRLVDEQAQPIQLLVKLKPGERRVLDFGPDMAARRFDLVITNRTGWVGHAAPPPKKLAEWHKAEVKVTMLTEGKYMGSIAPGNFASVPDAPNGIELVCVDEPCTVLVFAFPL